MAERWEQDAQRTSRPHLRTVTPVPIGHLVANPFQPRLRIDTDELRPLIESIQRFGFLGHIEARYDPVDRRRSLQIVLGHRRVEAAKVAGLATIPVAITERSDDQMRRITFVENAARKALSYWEEALFLGTMKRELGLSVRQIAEALGVSRSYVQERLDLLKLPVGPLREAAERDEIGFSIAWYLTQMPGEEREELFDQVRRGQLNVSDLRMLRRAQTRRRQELEQREELAERPLSAPTAIPAPLRGVEPPSAVSDLALRTMTDRDAVDRRSSPQAEPAIASRAPAVIQPSSVSVRDVPPNEPTIDTLSHPVRDGRATAGHLAAAPAVGEGPGIFFDRTLIPRHSGYDYAIEAIKQLEANAYHLRQKLAKADFSELDAELRRRLRRAKGDLREVMALLP